MIEIKRVKKWAHNTRYNHKQRGLPLELKPKQIYTQAVDVLLENGGCCPECGHPFEFGTKHWISLEYINPKEFEVICVDCNFQRAVNEQQMDFLNSK